VIEGSKDIHDSQHFITGTSGKSSIPTERFMAEKRTIKAKDIVNDLRAGMTNVQLMDKYQLSAKGLASIFTKLMDAKALREGELADRVPLAQDTVNLEQMRCLPRNYLMFRLQVYEANNQVVEGHVRDITERGLQTAGIRAKAGEVKELLIQPDELADVHPFGFEAECRWSRLEVESEQYVAGFQITNISEESLQELRKLIEALTLGD
jgi:hypothetical protein